MTASASRAPAGDKVLVVASCLPPMVGGSAKIMRNLFGAFPRGSLVYLRGNNASFRLGQDDPLGPVEVADMPNFLRRRHFRIGLPAYLEYLWAPVIAWKAFRLARRQKARAIFVNYPFAHFLIAGWLASRLARLPLFVYMHDLWEETAVTPLDRWMARTFERRIFRDAAAVYAITEAAAEHYRAKHGIEARVLLHAVNPADGAPAGAARPDAGGPARSAGRLHPEEGPSRVILFTGGVYHMNRDALQAMAKAIETLPAVPGDSPGSEVRLLVCCPNDPLALARWGIAGARVESRFVDTATAIRLQHEADLLYLPLAFDTPWQDEIRTVFPTKAVEYLVSGRPILLHAPAGCYTAADARRFGWAHVVDSLDPRALQAAVGLILSDEGLREKLVEGARAAAAHRDASRIAAELQRDLGLL